MNPTNGSENDSWFDGWFLLKCADGVLAVGAVAFVGLMGIWVVFLASVVRLPRSGSLPILASLLYVFLGAGLLLGSVVLRGLVRLVVTLQKDTTAKFAALQWQLANQTSLIESSKNGGSSPPDIL